MSESQSEGMRFELASAAFFDLVDHEMAKQHVERVGDLREFSLEGLCMNLADEFRLPQAELQDRIQKAVDEHTATDETGR